MSRSGKEAPKTGTAAPRRRRWWVRLLRGSFWTVLILVVLVRITVRWWLPPVLDRLAEPRGLGVEYGSLDLGLLFGEIELQELRVHRLDAPEAPALLELDHLRVNVDLSALILGLDLVVDRVEIDGLRAHVERLEDGSLAVGQHGGGEESAVEEVAQELSAALDFGLPLEVRAIRVQQCGLHWVDRAVEPAVDVRLVAEVRLSDFGHADRDARLSVHLHSPEFLGALDVAATLRGAERTLRASVGVEVREARPQVFDAYLRPLGVEAADAEWHLDTQLDVELDPVADHPTASRGFAELSRVELRCHPRDALEGVLVAVQALRLEVGGLDLEHAAGVGLDLGRLAVAGLTRREDGRMALGALSLGPGAEEDEAADAPDAAGVPVEIAATEAAPAAEGPAFALGVDHVHLGEIAVALRDETLREPAELSVQLGPVTLRGPGLDLREADQPIDLELGLRATGIEELRVSGMVVPLGDEPRAELSLDVRIVDLSDLAPYLAAVGLEAEPGPRSLHAGLRTQLTRGNGSERLTLDLEGARFGPDAAPGADADAGPPPWIALEALRLQGEYLPDDRDPVLRIEDLGVEGPAARAHRDAQGRWHVLGFAVVPPDRSAFVATEARPPPAAPSAGAEGQDLPAPPEPPPADSPRSPLRIELARADLSGVDLRLHDDLRPVSEDLVLDDLQASLRDLGIGGDPRKHPRSTATAQLIARVPRLCESFEIDGRIESRPGALDLVADFGLNATGVETTAVDPWLEEAGIQSRLQSATLVGRFDGALRQTPEAFELRAALSEVRWAEGTRTLAGLRSLSLDTGSISSDRVDLGTLLLDGVELEAARDEDGVLEVAGFRLLGRGPGSEAAAEAVPAPPAPAPLPESSSDRTTPDAPAAPTGSGLTLAELRIADVQLRWRDAAVRPALDTVLRVDGGVRDFSLVDEDAAPFELKLSVDGVVETLSVDGTLRLGSTVQSSVGLTLEGLNSSKVVGYFPAANAPRWTAAGARARLDLSWTPNPEGGHALQMELRDVDARERGSATPWMALEALECVASRIDPEARIYVVDELSTKGLELGLTRQGGVYSGFGLSLGGASSSEVEGAEPAAPARPSPDLPPGGDPPAAPPERAPSRAAAEPLPLLRTGAIDLGIDRLVILDLDRGEELLRSYLKLDIPSGQTWLGPQSEDLGPWRLGLELGAEPLLERLSFEMTMAPFAPDPTLKWTVDAKGIDGATLADLIDAPGLSAEDFQGGSLHGEFESVLRVRRRGPLDFDLDRGVAMEVWLQDFAVRPGGDEVAAGFESLYLDIQRYSPRTGDMRLQTVELSVPVAHLRQDAKGLHVAGFTLAAPEPGPGLEPPPPAPAGSEAAATPTAATPTAETPTAETPNAEAATAEPTPQPAAPMEAAGPRIEVEQLLVNGADLSFEDRSFEPAMKLPLSDLDVEVRGLSNPPDRSMTFRVSAQAGEISLPERIEGRYLVFDMLNAAAQLATGGAKDRKLEPRPWFGALEVQGRLRPGPVPDGFARLTIRDFEMQAVRGPADFAGVDIGEGLMNTRVDVRFQGEELDVNTRTVFRDLSMSEPAGGPISTYLRLPAPLDTVLFLLRDEKAEQNIPFSFRVDRGGVGKGAMVAQASKALGLAIAEAITASPTRLVGPLSNLDPRKLLASRSDAKLDLEPMTLNFRPGSLRLDGAAQDELRRMARRLRGSLGATVSIEHEIGGGDRARVQELAHPDRETCLAMVERLRQRRRSLWNERAPLVEDLRAARAIGQEVAVAQRELSGLDRELARTEEALDRALALLQPASTTSFERRTRDASLSLARARLEEVRAALQNYGVSAGRILVRRPRYRRPDGEEGGAIVLKPQPLSPMSR